MMIALMFGQPDVDGFRDTLDADQWEEWRAYASLFPQGWAATRLQTQRLSFMIARGPIDGRARQSMKESAFVHRLTSEVSQTAADEEAKWKALAKRSEIEERVRTKRALQKKKKPNG
jgi:hypothetical protein